MTFVLIGLPFFKSISQGWLTYYNNSEGPKFTEEQIRMADEAASTLETCFPVEEYLDPGVHSEVCKHLVKKQFAKASRALESGPTKLNLGKTISG